MTTKTNIGGLYEKFLAKIFNFKRVPGSGNGNFWKMDLEGNWLLLSAKATNNKSFRLTVDDLEEVREAIYGPGGLGGEFVPAMIIGFIEGDEPAPSDKSYLVIEASDFITTMTEESKFFDLSKSEAKFIESQTPGLLRN